MTNKLPPARLVCKEAQLAATLRKQRMFALILCISVMAAVAATWSR